MSDLKTATEIYRQLGGHKFAVMTGAKNFLGDENSFMFSLPARLAANGINKVKITLEPSDTYTVAFYLIRGTSFKTIATVGGVYNDNLRAIFTAHTGLDTSM